MANTPYFCNANLSRVFAWGQHIVVSFWNKYILAMMLSVLLFMDSATVLAAGTIGFEGL